MTRKEHVMVPESYKTVIKIRAFEELILDLFGQNKLSGTTHTYIGEEATAAAIMKHVTDDDVIFSNHRCHGHYLAYGGPERKLLAEIMSKKSGLCQGKGGSQHIHYKNFFTNGIQGGIVPNATGVAFAQKLRGTNANTVVFLGDGTLGQGVVYESLNIASILSIPCVYVIEDNAYAMSTKSSYAVAGDIKTRIEGFAVKTFEIASTDVDELDAFFAEVFDYINSERKPVCAVVHNYRLGAHSKGDDTRDPDEIAAHRAFDPVKLIADKIGDDEVTRLYDEYRASFEAIERELEAEPTITVDIPTPAPTPLAGSLLPTAETRYVEGIRASFLSELAKNPKLVFLGEDICDPYGGAFKATKGISPDYASQIYNMPISEACIVGLSVGLGMGGMLPVAEMMFGDFITLGFDQLLNHASKFGWVYDTPVPMIVRVPSGAKRGYGPTHSQSLEKFLIGIPCIKVFALSPTVDPEKAYAAIFASIAEPTVVIENKKLYGQKTWAIEDSSYGIFTVREASGDGFPTVRFTVDEATQPDCYAICYGGMVEDTLAAAEELMLEDEIQVDIIVLSQLSPLPLGDLKTLVRTNAPVFVLEEGTACAGIGAELIASFAECGIGGSYHRIAAPDMPIPNGIALESQVIPDKDRIVSEIRAAL